MATGRVPTTANSPLTAKGDLFGYSTTQARVPVGSDGETLVADSSTSTGLRWSGATTQNPVINSAFDIWQRGTSIAGSGSAYLYTADRWQMNAVSGFTVSRQPTNDTTNLPFIQYCGRFARNAGSTSTALNLTYNSFETVNSIPFVGRTVTFSFYARRGANFSGSGNALMSYLLGGTGTDQSAMIGYTSATDIILESSTLTTTWQRFTYTANVPTNINELAVGFYYAPTGTAGAADFFEVTGVQLDVGSVALPFRRSAATLAGELAACQRYFQIISGNVAGVIGAAAAYNSSSAYVIVSTKQQMRTNPTLYQITGTDFFVIVGNGTGDNFNSFSDIGDVSPQGLILNITSGISVTQGFSYWVRTANASAVVGLQAEL